MMTECCPKRRPCGRSRPQCHGRLGARQTRLPKVARCQSPWRLSQRPPPRPPLVRREQQSATMLSHWLRSKNYSPLPGPSHPKYRNGSPFRQERLFLAFVLVSFFINVYYIIPPWFAWPSPLDNYQSLHQTPSVNRAFLSSLPPISSSKNAIVTTLYTDNFAAAVATLGHSLRKSETTARLILLYLPDKVSQDALCLATSSGFVPQPVTRIPPPRDGQGVHRHFKDQYTKLSLWTLDQQGIDAVVYLDADTLVRRNLDELFYLPYNFAAVPDIFDGFILSFNAGFMFLRPSTDVFNTMVGQIATARYRAEDAEQSFLNHFFGAEAVRLPYMYNGNQAIKMRSQELWAGIAHELRVVHYTMVKPFLGRDYAPVKVEDLVGHATQQASKKGGLYKDSVLWWRDMWLETRDIYGRQMERCHTNPLRQRDNLTLSS
ncbi:nucleotide-diphospho-sugar transferase [Cristinia sonorae]|uniref:Nucleotide-diphospho-sugar transferase n=1 Tax=Cristinia sonorae TaxID=1940300 RepID=A0A8K0XMX4_9AGAR|nr:nucleotide-diphospho-sugar transferase [Cristinia sonorae]